MSKRFDEILIKSRTVRVLGFAFILCFPQMAYSVEFNGSGFLTLGVAKMLSNNPSDAYFVSDYGQGAIYEHDDGWALGPDSKLGLQGIVKFNSQWSATGQVVSRGAHNGKVDLEWLFLSYKATDNLTLQVGRKRLPLFYYSETQDVGVALPWLRLPPPSYGWDVVNFNGVNLMHQGKIGDWNSTAEVFYGNETRRDSPFLEIYNGTGTNWDEKWNNIHGLEWSMNHDWLDLRFSYVNSNLEYWNSRDKLNSYISSQQSFYSIAAMADRNNWVVLSEISKIDRSGDLKERDWAGLAGIGYRFGKWLPLVTISRYQGHYLDGRPQERFDQYSLSLRYDLTASSAIKVQFDMNNDRSEKGITCYQDPVNCSAGSLMYGDNRMIGLSYDVVF